MILGETLSRLENQIKRPVQTLVVVPTKEDLPEVIPDFVEVVFSKKGSCVQRNVGIEHSQEDSDILLFIDDDTFLHPTYIAFIEHMFSENQEVAGVTGHLLRNGDVSIEEADRLLSDCDAAYETLLTPGGFYGCNFAVRKSMLSNLRFDERLVLYGWLEDADFSMQFRQTGRICFAQALKAVHLMYPSGGRTNHVRFGFSQIMNPYYLSNKNKKLFPFSEVIKNHWAKAFPANLIKGMGGSARKWRRDRLRGNLIAFRFILMGKMNPEYATEL
jgi:glycosyltransferase involved in cell wall biosynthesis